MYPQLIIARHPNSEDQACIAALLDENAHVQQLFVTSADPGDLAPGAVFLGTVETIHRQSCGAFVRVRDAASHLVYLPLVQTEGEKGYFVKGLGGVLPPVRAGDRLVIQVRSAAHGHKRAPATAIPQIAGRYAVLSADRAAVHVSRRMDPDRAQAIRAQIGRMGPVPYSLIIRTAASEADDSEICDEVRQLIRRMERLLQRAKTSGAGTCLLAGRPLWHDLLDLLDADGTIETDDPVIKASIEALCEDGAPLSAPSLYQDPMQMLAHQRGLVTALEKHMRRVVLLRSGATIVIEQTEAFVSIDVNSGKFDRHQDAEDAAFTINREAAAAALREIRLRQLCGTILIDFINMKDPSHAQALLAGMRETARMEDPMLNVVDMTALGIAELTRKKHYPTLAEQLSGVRMTKER